MSAIAPVSGWNSNVFVAVSRLLVSAKCNIGNAPKGGHGTGFWIQHGSTYFLCTNKHVVDPSMLFGPTYSLDGLFAQLHEVDAQGNVKSTIGQVKLSKKDVFKHASADVALVRWQWPIPTVGNLGFLPIPSDLLATREFFKDFVHPMDVTSFIGYPEDWWDLENNVPIVRIAHIASLPSMDFSNPSIPTSHASLVSGFSFSGSSGSPVLLHEKGLNIGEGLKLAMPNYAPARLLGIMAGHWKEPADTPGMLKHTGLSYFVKSTAILELLQNASSS